MLQKHLCFTFLIALLVSSSSSYSILENVERRQIPIVFPRPFISVSDGTRSSMRSYMSGLFGKKWGQRVVNVDDFGAKGDGVTDDSKAFIAAWKNACLSTRSVLLVPSKRTYLLKPITFSGPCKPGFTMKIKGTIVASPSMKDYEKDERHWLIFKQVTDFTVNGGGTINGNGEIWWQNSCKTKKTQPCNSGAPTALTFERCTNLRVNKLRIKDSQQMHLTFFDCESVYASDLIVTAPEKSPNTDGIHVTGTQDIRITNSIIATGDDCISIVSGSKAVRATNIMCGPGHGISIGSLGKNHAEDHVSEVLVNGATLIGTTNGVRIKTWQGGRGYARNIVFQNILMRNVSNPIIIDQNYCDQKGPCTQQKEAVQVKNVVYKNIRGTSASEVAMKFDCSKTVPCANIVAENVELFREEHGASKATCANVRLAILGNVFPQCDESYL